MKNDPITSIIKQTRYLSPGDELGKAVSVLRAAQTQALPVTYNGRMLGLITEQALLTLISTDSDSGRSVTVGDIMDRNPVCGNIYMSLAQAAEMLNSSRVDVLPIIDEFGSFQGIVTRSDMLSAELDVLQPPMVAGMATPLGVHLTTGAITAGAGNLGLYLAGVGMMIMLEAARGAVVLLMMLLDKVFSTHLLMMAASPPVGNLSFAALRADIVPYAMMALQIILFLLFLRLSPVAGYHAAEHQVVHAIEAGEPLVPGIVTRMPRAHPRCGTNLMAAFTLFIIVASVLGNQTGVLIAFLVVLAGWRAIGYYLQQYITTKPPAPKHVQNGIKVGEELLAKYRAEPNKPADGWTRIWNMGIIQVAMGFITILAFDQWLSPRMGGIMPWF